MEYMKDAESEAIERVVYMKPTVNEILLMNAHCVGMSVPYYNSYHLSSFKSSLKTHLFTVAFDSS